MSVYMGRNESSEAITEALEVIRKYPHQWITYNPNDPLANSVVTFLKHKGKIVVNRFNQFQAAPKYKTNPAPGIAERSKKLHAIRKVFVKDLNAAKRNGNRVREDYMIRKINKLDRLLFSQPGNTMRAKLRNAKPRKNPGPKANRYKRLAAVADAADAAFMRAVKKQFPKERPGDARYRSNRFNAATKKAAARMRKATDALLAFVRGK